MIVNVTPEQFLQVVNDYENYPKFLAQTKKVTVKKISDREQEVTYEIEIVKRISYTLRQTSDGFNVRWSLIRGDLMKKNDGSWQLSATPDGKTKAVYTINLELPMLVPGAIQKMLAEASLPDMLASFKNRAESVHGGKV